MANLLKNGAVFLHIPKTGGSWVTGVLEELNLVETSCGPEHADFGRAFWHTRFHREAKTLRQMLRRAVGSKRAASIQPDCFRFCFVREPLDWYESWWRFMQGLDWKSWGDERDPYRWHPNSMLNGLGSRDFNTFVHNVNRKRPGYVTEMYGWYVRPGVGFVGKMERLQRDLLRAFRLMGLDVDASKIAAMPPLNESPCHIPKPEWDPELKRTTLRLEYAGYVRFGYPVEEAQLAEVGLLPQK
jgi:hypothetical protein